MNITEYIKETKNELSHVSWPTQRQAWWFTVLVIAISIGIAAYLGAFDFLFKYLLEISFF